MDIFIKIKRYKIGKIVCIVKGGKELKFNLGGRWSANTWNTFLHLIVKMNCYCHVSVHSVNRKV